MARGEPNNVRTTMESRRGVLLTVKSVTRMQFLSKSNVIVGILALVMALGTVAPAAAQCPQLSDVEWWTNTEGEVRRVVLTSYGGSWDAYIERWKQQRKELQGAFDTQTSVEIKSRALVFRGNDLKDYIKQVDER